MRPHDLQVAADAERDDARGAWSSASSHLGFEVRVELARDDGEHVQAQLTRDDAERLELEPGQIVYVEPTRETTFA